MKSPGIEGQSSVFGDFNNHKEQNKAINSVCYDFSGTTKIGAYTSLKNRILTMYGFLPLRYFRADFRVCRGTDGIGRLWGESII
jgi:hypothetical protein